MPCPAALQRHYDTRFQARIYLASRGFVPVGDTGWANGRWAATVARADRGVDVTVWLRLPEVA